MEALWMLNILITATLLGAIGVEMLKNEVRWFDILLITGVSLVPVFNLIPFYFFITSVMED